MAYRENEPPMAEPIAYFITWAAYGTWLPGDERGWVEYRNGWQMPDPVLKLEAAEDANVLDVGQRAAVEKQIADTCQYRRWQLHAVNCRSNHLHVVVTAPISPTRVRSQLKAWCTRRLKELDTQRRTSRDCVPRENFGPSAAVSGM